MRILLAEDDASAVQSAEFLMDLWNYHLDVVGDGKSAVEQVQNAFYDLVLMDIRMPVMDGYAAMRQIRTLGLPWYQPVLALSATDSNEECLEAGADDFLGKPYDCEVLHEKILKLTSKITCIGIKSDQLIFEEKMPEDRQQFLKLMRFQQEGFGLVRLLETGDAGVTPATMQIVFDYFFKPQSLMPAGDEKNRVRSMERLPLKELPKALSESLFK